MGAYSIISLVVSCIVYALSIIGMWITFRKAGRWGWLSIIPVVNTIMICIIGWRKAWPVIVEIIVGFVGVLLIFLGGIMLIFTEEGITFSEASMLAVLIIGLILIIVAFVFYIIITNRFSKSFGHRAGFTVGLILVPWIMYMVLAFGKSEYIYEKKHQFGKNKSGGSIDPGDSSGSSGSGDSGGSNDFGGSGDSGNSGGSGDIGGSSDSGGSGDSGDSSNPGDSGPSSTPEQ